MVNDNKIIFGSVVYPNVLCYINDFLRSVRTQTTKDFKLLLVNDGVPLEELEQKLSFMQGRYDIVSNNDNLSPAQLRVKLIEEAKKRGTCILVIGDADDIFSENRIVSIARMFEAETAVDFVYNDLRLFDGTKAMPQLPEFLDDVRGIAEYNFLGMSNTAIRVEKLSDTFIQSLYECKSQVFDWYLYSRLLLFGYVGIRMPDVYTFYRIYDSNYVGVQMVTEENVEKEIEVKREHYEMLRDYDPLFENLYNCYEKRNIERIIDLQPCHYWWGLTRAAN